MDSARALIARGWGVSLVSRCLRVSRAQLHVILRRTDDWKDGRRSRHSDDTDVLLRIHHVIGELPTYGYRRVEEKRDAMQSLVLPPPARQALAQAALTYRYGDEHQPVTTADILTPRRREDYGKDLWSAYQTIQENMLKGGISGRSAKGKRIHTRAIHSIDTDIKLNRALWVMAETMLESLR